MNQAVGVEDVLPQAVPGDPRNGRATIDPAGGDGRMDAMKPYFDYGAASGCGIPVRPGTTTVVPETRNQVEDRVVTKARRKSLAVTMDQFSLHR